MKIDWKAIKAKWLAYQKQCHETEDCDKCKGDIKKMCESLNRDVNEGMNETPPDFIICIMKIMLKEQP